MKIYSTINDINTINCAKTLAKKFNIICKEYSRDYGYEIYAEFFDHAVAMNPNADLGCYVYVSTNNTYSDEEIDMIFNDISTSLYVVQREVEQQFPECTIEQDEDTSRFDEMWWIIY